MDWALEWHAGVPPEGELGVSGSINWLYVYTLERAAQLEDWHGEPELAARARRIAASLAALLDKALWDERRGLFADDLSHAHFSEHTQCLALLSGHLPAGRRTDGRKPKRRSPTSTSDAMTSSSALAIRTVQLERAMCPSAV